MDLMSLDGTIKIYCEICDYGSPEKKITLYSGKTLHVGCSRCKTGMLSVVYTFKVNGTNNLLVYQDSPMCIITPDVLVLASGYTALIEYSLNYPRPGYVKITIPYP